MKTLNNFKKHQAGITLIEVSIGLIIAAIVAAVAFIAFQNNSRRNETRENVTAITEIIAEAKQKFGRTNSFASLVGPDANGVDIAVTSATVPEAIANNGNSYAGNVLLFSSAADGAAPGTGDFATLAWTNVSAEQCYDLVNALAPASTDIRVGNPGVVAQTQAAMAAAAADGDTTFQAVNGSSVFVPALANTACAAAGREDALNMFFVFNRG